VKISVYFILFGLIASVFVAGCSTPGSNPPDTKPVATGVTVTTSSPAVSPELTSLASNKTNASIQGTPAPTFIPTKDINKHFLTIAFSEYNGVILRQEQSQPITVSLFGKYLPEDDVAIGQFLRDFNRVSKTQKFFDNVKHGEDADLWINLFPESQLHSLQRDAKDIEQVQYTKYESLFSDKILYSVDFSGQVFINRDLPADQRRHYLLRALTFWLGITGEATDEDSFFYPSNTGQQTLSESDWKALMILYGPNMKNNLTVNEVKNRLYLG
jgi:hypothetical protein